MFEEPKISDPTYRDVDIKISVLIASLCALVVVITLAFLSMSLLFKSQEKKFFDDQVLLSEKTMQRRLPLVSVLQINEKQDIDAYRKMEKGVLHSSMMINEKEGIARLAITDTKKYMLSRGLMPIGQEGAMVVKPEVESAPEEKSIEEVAVPEGTVEDVKVQDTSAAPKDDHGAHGQ